MLTNIWNEDLDKVYQNNEDNNTLGGYYPIGEGGTWHSGIHIYNESVMPFLRGTLVAYRLNENFVTVDKKTEITDSEFKLLTAKEKSYYPKFSDNIFKKKAKVRIQDPKEQEQISNNFFILKHSFFDGKLEFYSVYNNIIPDNEYYKDFLEYKKYDNSFSNKKLFFYRTWHYKCILDSSCKEESVIFGKKIFKGSYISSCKLGPQDTDYNYFKNNYKSQMLNYHECKTEEGSNFDSNFTIQSDYVDIKTFKVNFEGSDLILPKKDLIYRSNRTFNKLLTYTSTAEEEYNQEQLEKDDFLITKKGKGETGIKQNREYIETKVMIPYFKLSTKFQAYDNIYSRRTDKIPDGDIYRVSDIEDISIDEDNCPLYYEDITKDDSLLFSNGIVRISGAKLLHLFSLIKANKIFTICRNEDIDEIISKFEIIDSDKSNIEELDISEKDYIFFYKNGDWNKQNILFFVDGKIYEPIAISSISNSELKANLNKLLSKKEIFEDLPKINSNISILRTEPISVYKMDSYKEILSIYDENPSYKKIKENKQYCFFKLYIQNDNPRTYKVENNIKITSLSGYIKKTVKKTYPIHGKLLYNTLGANKEPKIFIDSDFEFTSDELPNGPKVALNTIIYNNETYSFESSSSDILQIKIDDKENYKLTRSENIQYPNIDINSNFILGEPYSENKYIADQPFYDIAVFLKKNYLEDSELQKMDKKFYIYSEILKNEKIYNDTTNSKYTFFIPEESKIKSLDIYHEGTETVYSVNFDYIAIYLKDTDLKLSFDKITLINEFKLNYVMVDSNRKTSLDKKSNLKILSDYFSNKAGGKKLKTDSVDNYYCKVYITNKEVNLPDNMYVIGSNEFINQNKIISEGNQKILTASFDYDDLLYYNCDPRYNNAKNIIVKHLFIPKGTTFELLEYLPGNSSEGYRLKILSIPVYISKKGVKMQCIIDKKPSHSIILYGQGRIYTEANKEKDEIAKRFYQNINSIIGGEYDYGNIVTKEGRYNVFIPAEKLNMDRKWFFKEGTLYEKYKKVKTTGNETFILYERNPLYLNLTTSILDNNYKIKSIEESQVKKAADRFGKKYCPVRTEKESFYIPYENIEKYRENAFNWKKFFVNCEKESDDDFLCDLKKFSKNFDFDKDEKEALDLIFNNKTIQNDLQELYHSKTKTNDSIKTIFRHSVVTHLHELDEKAYEKISETPDIKYIKDRCKKEEICNAVSSNSVFNFIKNQNGLLTFVHPVYFLKHLKEANIFEFNPYENQGSVTINENGWILQTRTQQFKSNPGFAPYNTDLSAKGYGYNGIKYAYITCLFDVKRTIDIHTGIDFGSWQRSVPIKSFIRGTVLECTWHKSKKEKSGSGYGNMMLIEGENGYLYLLAHLTSYLKEKGDSVFPGEDVAMSGQTGNSDGYHLHLEIIKPLSKSTKVNTMYIIDETENQFEGWSSEEQRKNRYNPFNHEDKFGSFSGGN